MKIDFIDLKAQQLKIKSEIDQAIANVLSHGRYVLGPEVTEFETKLAKFGQAKYAIGCANGTDALILPLMAWGIGPGDAVFCPSFTFCATAEVIAHLGATPIFVDIDRKTYNIDAQSLDEAIEAVKIRKDLTARAVIAVDLFGQSADYKRISDVVKAHEIKLIADSAQSFGTTLDDKHPLYWADISTTSFFPAKPLGCYGDGGAVLTNDDELAQIISSLHIHGMGADKYQNIRVGINSRLDTLQAAILIPKLAIFPEEISSRNIIAQRYNEGLKGHVMKLPHVFDGVQSTWAQYTIEVNNPDIFAKRLKDKSIPTARYYPRPVHMQAAYNTYPIAPNGLANTMDCIDKVISLPMSPYLDRASQQMIIEAVQSQP